MRKPYDWYDGPHVMNELRQTHDCEYRRPRRVQRLKYLTHWGDSRYRETKSWKDNRKTQYRQDGRGQRHEMTFDTEDAWRKQWNIEKYFKEHDIPYCTEDIKEARPYSRTVYYEMVKSYQVPYYCYTWEFITQPDGTSRFGRVVKHQIGFEWKFKSIPLDKPVTTWYNGSVSTGWKLIWWSDKDIGIDHILKRIHW